MNIVSAGDAEYIITEYCLEHGKNPSLIRALIEVLFAVGTIREPFKEALQYYTKKYNINLLYSAPNEKGDRYIIKVY